MITSNLLKSLTLKPRYLSALKIPNPIFFSDYSEKFKLQKLPSPQIQTVSKFYQKNGYALIKNAIPKQVCSLLKNQMHFLTKNQDPNKLFNSIFSTKIGNRVYNDKYFLQSGDKIRFFFQNDAFDQKNKLKQEMEHSLNKVGHSLHQLNKIYERFTYGDIFKQIVTGVFKMKAPVVVQSMYIFKNPKIGGQVNPHTDNTYLRTKPLSVAGIWIALDDSVKENGAMWGVPKSHLQQTNYFMKRATKGKELLEKQSPILNTDRNRSADEDYVYHEPKEKPIYDLSNAVPLQAPAGTIVLLHGDFVHYSQHNSSDKSRHAFTFHTVESRNTIWEHDNWLQRGRDVPFRPMLNVNLQQKYSLYDFARENYKKENWHNYKKQSMGSMH